MSKSPNITIDEAAKLAGFTKARMYQALKAGELEEGPQVTVRWQSTKKARTVTRTSLREWLKTRKREAVPQ